jgi:hypothetical protein
MIFAGCGTYIIMPIENASLSRKKATDKFGLKTYADKINIFPFGHCAV